jgi:hypothetical protein
MMTDIPEPAMESIMNDSSVTMRSMAVQYFTDHLDGNHLYLMSQKETDPDIQYFILESLANLDPVKAKEFSLQLLDKTDKNPIIYLALVSIAAVDIEEALRQATRYDMNNSSAIYAARADLYAKKGSGASIEFFKDIRAKNLPLDYLEDFVVSFVKYISNQSNAVQEQGMQLLNSEFYLQGPSKEYRRFYLILGLARQYKEQKDGSFKAGLLSSIKRNYSKETNSYLRDALKQGLGDMVE